MGTKSWIITSAPLIIGLAFTTISFVTGQVVNETHVQLLDWLLYAFIGSGALGVSSAGYKKYIEFKKPT